MWIPETAPFAINEFSLLLALSPNSQVFPTPQKPTSLNSRLIRNGKNRSIDAFATSKPLFIVFIVHLYLPNRNPFSYFQFHPLMEVGTDLCQFCPLNSNIQLDVWNVADFDFFFALQSEDNEALIFSKIISLASMLSCISYISLLSLKKSISSYVKLAYGPFTILSFGYITTSCHSIWHFTSLMKFEWCGWNIHFCLKFWSES